MCVSHLHILLHSITLVFFNYYRCLRVTVVFVSVLQIKPLHETTKTKEAEREIKDVGTKAIVSGLNFVKVVLSCINQFYSLRLK